MSEGAFRFEISVMADFAGDVVPLLEEAHYVRRITLSRQEVIELFALAEDGTMSVRVVPASIPEM